MNEVWQLAKREVVERRLVFVVAAVLGLAAPAVATFVKVEPIVGSLAIAVGLGHGVALLVGASTVNRAVREGRLSFFFNRPVRASSIWWGKLLGAVLLGLGVQLLVVLPGYVWECFRGENLVDAEAVFFASCAGLLGSVLVGHVGGTMIGSRSKFTLVDLGALVSAVAIAWTSWQRLRLAMADSALFWLLILMAGAGLLGSLLGGWMQVSRGRVDPLRSHRVLSLVLWGSVVSAALLGWGFSRWVLNVHPEQMGLEQTISGSESPWFVSRNVVLARDLDARNGVAGQFLTHGETGEWHLLDVGPAGHLQARLSRDAGVVAWTTHNRLGPQRSTAWIAERTAAGMESRRELPFAASEASHWELSPTGDRIVDIHFAEDPVNGDVLNLRLRVWEVSTGRPQVEEWVPITLDRRNWRPNTRLFWDEDDTIRLFVEADRELILWRMNPSGALEEEARLPLGDDLVADQFFRTGFGLSGGVGAVAFSPGGGQVLVGYRFVEEPTEAVATERSEAASRAPGTYDRKHTLVRFSLYNGGLSERLWTLPPVSGWVSELELRDGLAMFATFKSGFGQTIRMGGPNGWGPEQSTWGLFGRSGIHSRVFRSGVLHPSIAVVGLMRADLLTGERSPLPPSLRELWEYDRLPRQRFLGAGFRGGERHHPSMDQLFFRWPDDDRLDEPSLVRVDFDAGTVEGVYR